MAPTVIVFATNNPRQAAATSGRGNFSPSARASPLSVTRPMRAHIIWIAAMSGQVMNAVHRTEVPSCAPTTE